MLKLLFLHERLQTFFFFLTKGDKERLQTIDVDHVVSGYW